MWNPEVQDNDVILVDIDGTVAEKGTRHPMNWKQVGEDQPRKAVLISIKALYSAGYKIIFMSGRKEICRLQTEMWLNYWFGGDYELFMRSDWDNRPDYEIKAELFEKNIANKYNVIAVYDDRDSVVKHWREELKLECFQVQPGPF